MNAYNGAMALNDVALRARPDRAARLLDIVLSLCLIVVLSPLMLAVAIAIRLSDGGPVLFGQMRVGRMGQAFRCWKFRSMVTDSEARLQRHLAENPAARAEWDADRKLRDDPRITPFGQLLRKTSIDELPQLWNVLIGEMSLVGPRPIVPAEISFYKSHFTDYCRCRPGITGLWQVSGRNDVSYDQRVQLDVRYAQSSSLLMNIGILCSTVPAVLTRRGSY